MLDRNEVMELIARIEAADNWSDIEVEEYERLCETLGLEYHNYDDPDRLFDDIKEAAEKLS
jgi:hypothetical protein|nr:MAG TPA: hypothetical protein [Caudoviricetes sp.]